MGGDKVKKGRFEVLMGRQRPIFLNTALHSPPVSILWPKAGCLARLAV